MLSFSGKNILCKILNDDNLPKNKSKIYLSDDDTKNKTFNSMHLLKKEAKFQYLPNKHQDRDVLLFLGMAGSGKTYAIHKYLLEFQKTFPKFPIYLFSEKTEDPSIDEGLLNLKRIKIDETLNECEWTDFEDSMCVFDDVDSFETPLKKIVYSIRDKLLKLGRQKHINIIMSNHNSTDGKETKTAINEARVIVVFLANYNRSMKYLLENYLGLTKDQIVKLKKHEGRATYFLKTYPNIVLQEKFISTLKDL